MACLLWVVKARSQGASLHAINLQMGSPFVSVLLRDWCGAIYLFVRYVRVSFGLWVGLACVSGWELISVGLGRLVYVICAGSSCLLWAVV